MCGICGTLSLRGEAVNPALVHGMAESLIHRGPDGHGFYIQGEIALGHRRLSIIDLDGGSQPISNEDGTVVVVFNGEIYNFVELKDELEKKGHIFSTRSDTEVIVHAYEQWGAGCVTRFNGMFAFALWDCSRRMLVLARDHLGIKPLYYAIVNDRLYFASEIKAILRCRDIPRQVDTRSLAILFTLRYVPSPATLFADIKKLPPGCLMTAENGRIRLSRFWETRPTTVHTRLTNNLVIQYQELVEDAVRLQMRSDVPIGLFLSSGVDSGALLALMSGCTRSPVRTFTLGFEGGEETNEVDDAREIAHMFGSDHTEWIIGPREYEAYFERYMFDLEEPVGNETAAAFYFVSRMASQKVKVALTGQGADEPWAGYGRHLGLKISGFCDTVLPRGLAGPISHLVERHSRNERLRRGTQCLTEPDPLKRLVNIYSFYSPEMKANLFQPWLQEVITVQGEEARRALESLYNSVGDCDALTRMLYLDTRTNLPDDLLMVADKTSMANSLETRVPFLDRRLVEFIESLAPTLKLHGLSAKYMHKKAMEKWLPKKIIYRQKKGFANPVGEWLRKSMLGYLRDSLLTSGSAARQYFDVKYIERMIADHENRSKNHMRHLYLLLSFEMWHEKFIRSSVPESVCT